MGVPSELNSFYEGDNMLVPGGERVRVAMRVRPMMPHEANRSDENIITSPDTQHVLLSLKSGTKSFRFNAVLDEHTKQSEVFNLCGVHVLAFIHSIGIDRLSTGWILSYHICLWTDRFRQNLHNVRY